MAFGFLKEKPLFKQMSDQPQKKQGMGMGKALGLGIAGGAAGVLAARKFGPKYNPTPKPEPAKDGKSVFSRAAEKYKQPAEEKKPFGSFERKPRTTKQGNAFGLKK